MPKKRFCVRRSPYDTFFVWDNERERVCDGYYTISRLARESCRDLNAAVSRGIDPWDGEAIYCHHDLHHEALHTSTTGEAE